MNRRIGHRCLRAKFRSSNEKIRAPLCISVPLFSLFYTNLCGMLENFKFTIRPYLQPRSTCCMNHCLSDNGTGAAVAIMMKHDTTKDRRGHFVVYELFASMAASLAKQIRVAVDHEGAPPRHPLSPPPPQQPGETKLTPCVVAWQITIFLASTNRK